MHQVGSLIDFAENCWRGVLAEVSEAAVYIDHAAAECFHWHSGDKAYLSFKNAGALSVHELSLFNLKFIKAKETKKAVIISTSAESSFYNETLKLILEKNRFSKCIIFCSVHTSVLDYNKIFPRDSKINYDELQRQNEKWTTDGKYETEFGDSSVTIIYSPIFTASLNDSVFLTPPFGNMMPPIDENSLLHYENDVEYFASSMHSLFSNLNVKEDVYSMGRLSNIVAEKLATLPSAINRRKQISDERTVSFILLDRTLDLCTACSYNTESLLGRILCTLPHLNHHNNDIAVNMSPFCLEGEECLSSFMVPGCLATNETNFLDLLLHKKQKDLLLAFNKMLNDMSTVHESPIKTKLATRVSAHSLEKLVHKFRNSENIENLTRSSKTLQIIIAAIQALKSDKTAQLELLVSFEKLILQNLAISRDASSIVAQLSNIIQSRSSRGLTMDNLLVLLIHVYSMVGNDINFPPQQEEQLRNSLADAIFEDMEKCNQVESSEDLSVYHQTLILLSFGISDAEVMKKTSKQIAIHIMDLFHAIASQRHTLQNYKSIISKSNKQEMAKRVGLVERLVTDLIDPNKPEIPDLQCNTFSLLSTSFNLLMTGRMKHPSDSALIIIYILGGITPDEARIVQEKSSSVSNHPKIIISGSRLLNPLDVLEKILLSNLSASLS